MRDQVHQERDVRLHAANAELFKTPLHPLRRVAQRSPPGTHLDQQRIVKRRDDRTAERRAAIKANPRSARRAIREDSSIVGHETILGVFGRDAALDAEPARVNVFLLAESDLGIA